jgi:hypothetical protein
MLHRSCRFVAGVLMACLMLPALAAELDCEKMLAETAARKLDKAAIGIAQQQLIELRFNPGGVDGWLGEKTRAALLQFCRGAQFALNNDLLVMLRNHEAIFKAHPDWKMTLASKGFQKWAEKQADAKEIGQTRQSGDSASVIALLERYGKRKESVPGVREGEDYAVSYMLTKDDFEQLKSRETVATRIGKLLDKAYADRGEFEAEAATVLKDVPDREEYVQLAEKYGQQQASYRLTAESFDELKVANVPDYVLQAIEGIKDMNYPDGELDVAVEAALSKLSERAMELKPELVKLAEITPSGASMTASSLAKFSEAQQGDPLAAAVLEKLAALQDVKYQNDKALAWAVKKVLMEIGEQIDNSTPIVLDHAEEVSVYVIDKASSQELSRKIKESTVPEIYLEMIGSLQGVDYPDAELFWLATKAKVEILGSNNELRKAIATATGKLATNKVDEPLLEELKAAKLSPAVLSLVGTLQGQKFDNAKALEAGIDNLFGQLGKQYEQYRPFVLAQAQKRHPFDKTKTIQWNGSSCNCVHNNLAGEVYGLYPYWMAGDKQVIDFSVQTRIGYYGLSFDDKGNIPNAAQWSGLDAGFIREARTYGTKVDLVIYRNDWRGWDQTSSEEKASLFDNLAANIAGLVDTPLTDTFSRMKPYLSLGGTPPPVMGDGVTLYFSGYPQDDEAVEAFNAFVRNLRDKLKSHGRKYSLNIMFRSAEMGKGIYEYPRLLSLEDSIEGGDKKLDGLFLVLLQEPTTYDKKMLRLNIENGLHGKDRMKLLRNVAMVLTYDGRNESQLTDDVIYAKDNFGGIGFWTQPVASGAAAAEAAASFAVAGDVLHDNFLNTVNGENALKPAVCQFICPNRWAFRIAWDIFVLVLLGSIALYFGACDWRNFFNKKFMYFLAGVVAPFLLLTFSLLFCDPSWEKISKGNGILILVIAGGLAYSIWNYYDNKRKADLP